MKSQPYTEFIDISTLTHSCNIEKDVISTKEPTPLNQVKFDALKAKLFLRIKDRENKNFLLNAYLTNIASLLGVNYKQESQE